MPYRTCFSAECCAQLAVSLYVFFHLILVSIAGDVRRVAVPGVAVLLLAAVAALREFIGSLHRAGDRCRLQKSGRRAVQSRSTRPSMPSRIPAVVRFAPVAWRMARATPAQPQQSVGWRTLPFTLPSLCRRLYPGRTPCPITVGRAVPLYPSPTAALACEIRLWRDETAASPGQRANVEHCTMSGMVFMPRKLRRYSESLLGHPARDSCSVARGALYFPALSIWSWSTYTWGLTRLETSRPVGGRRSASLRLRCRDVCLVGRIARGCSLAAQYRASRHGVMLHHVSSVGRTNFIPQQSRWETPRAPDGYLLPTSIVVYLLPQDGTRGSEHSSWPLVSHRKVEIAMILLSTWAQTWNGENGWSNAKHRVLPYASKLWVLHFALPSEILAMAECWDDSH